VPDSMPDSVGGAIIDASPDLMPDVVEGVLEDPDTNSVGDRHAVADGMQCQMQIQCQIGWQIQCQKCQSDRSADR